LVYKKAHISGSEPLSDDTSLAAANDGDSTTAYKSQESAGVGRSRNFSLKLTRDTQPLTCCSAKCCWIYRVFSTKLNFVTLPLTLRTVDASYCPNILLGVFCSIEKVNGLRRRKLG